MPGVVELQPALRDELKEPFGPIYTDAEPLLAAASEPVVAVGDIVTYHLLEAGYTPAVALVDERTERATVDEEIRAAIGGFDEVRHVANPAAVLTEELLQALVAAIESPGTTLIRVDGEEDLAALPAIVAAPDGASIVYGQPGEGMVHVTVDDEVRARARALLERMNGDTGRLWTALGQ